MYTWPFRFVVYYFIIACFYLEVTKKINNLFIILIYVGNVQMYTYIKNNMIKILFFPLINFKPRKIADWSHF